MPLTYTIDKAARLVTLLYDANPEFAEAERTIRAIFNDPDFEAGFKLLVDRHLVDEAPTTEYIKRGVRLVTENEARFSYIATVVKNDTSFGMVRMGHMLAGDTKVSLRVFTDLDEAKQWLRAANPK